MNRIWDKLRDWVILFFLLALAAGLLLARNEPVVLSLRAGALQTTAWVEARFAWVGRYFSALEENDLLREENIQLSSEVARSREAIIENERLRQLIGFRDTTSHTLLPARIIDKSFEQNLITIDQGARDSVKVGLAVVDERGIIGKVVNVSADYALVMPYQNPDFRVPAKILPIQAAGVVRGDSRRRDRLVMEFVSRTEPVLPGQHVVTSGFSESFPPGFSVGYVDSVAAISGRNQLLIYVGPTSPLDRAEYVFVVLDRPTPERLDLTQDPLR